MSFPGASDAPCGIFGASFGTTEFFRQIAFQNSAGDTLLSFHSLGSYVVEWQPVPSEVRRQVGGVVVEVSDRGIIMGTTVLQELDRCVLYDRQVEVVQVARYGDEHVEVDVKHVGR